jgi:phosphoribosylanthranilate isomerase
VTISVKICGIERKESLDIAIEYGADYVGFVFYQPSPRNITFEKAKQLISRVPKHISTVGLFVDPTNSEIDNVLTATDLDLIQLHGIESSSRVLEIKRQSQLPVIKAIKLANDNDLKAINVYCDVADYLLFDSKAPATVANALPGGNAISFNWKLLQGIKIPLPWMLAGGLIAKNIEEAVVASGAKIVDVSSGVENNLGIKDLNLIKNFLAIAKRIPTKKSV